MTTVKSATGDKIDVQDIIGLKLFIIDDRFYVKALVQRHRVPMGLENDWVLLAGHYDTKYDADKFIWTLPKVPLG